MIWPTIIIIIITMIIMITMILMIIIWYIPGSGGWHDLLSSRWPHPDHGKPCGPGISHFHISHFHISQFPKYCISLDQVTFVVLPFPYFSFSYFPLLICAELYFCSRPFLLFCSGSIFSTFWKLSPFDIIMRVWLLYIFPFTQVVLGKPQHIINNMLVRF